MNFTKKLETASKLVLVRNEDNSMEALSDLVSDMYEANRMVDCSEASEEEALQWFKELYSLG